MLESIKDSWITGAAFCLACGRKWQAVWPEWIRGTLECPSCHERKGVVSDVKVAPTTN